MLPPIVQVGWLEDQERNANPDGRRRARRAGSLRPGWTTAIRLRFVYLQNLAHARHLDDHALIERQRPTRKSGSRAARCEWRHARAPARA